MQVLATAQAFAKETVAVALYHEVSHKPFIHGGCLQFVIPVCIGVIIIRSVTPITAQPRTPS